MICNKRGQLRAADVTATAAIVVWVIAYFNLYHFVSIQSFAHSVPSVLKLSGFLLFFAVALFIVSGLYKGMLLGKPRLVSPIWFATVFVLSLVVAVMWADHQVMFRIISCSLVVFDRILYYLVCRKCFKARHIRAP
jgi:hypothetical protein